MPIRTNFPKNKTEYEGGMSDGWEYKLVFSGGNFKKSYEMIKSFLNKEGYHDIPLPKDADELMLFRYPGKNLQMHLFSEHGYIHNPIKILFPAFGTNKKGSLCLYLYNENDTNHLLKFYGLVKKKFDVIKAKN